MSSFRPRAPVMAYVFVLSLCIPTYFYLGPVRMTPFLLVLLALFVPLVGMWLSDAKGKKLLPDYLILAYCVWASIALIQVHGVGETIQPGAIVFLQTFGSYLLGRLYVTNAFQFRKIVYLQLGIIIAILPFALIENVTGKPVLLSLFKPFGTVLADSKMPPRMGGLRRVQAVFEHPILYGVFVGSLFAATYNLKKMSFAHFATLCSIVVAVFVSLSTGALLCLVVQILLITWGYVMRRNPRKWQIALVLFLSGYTLIDLLSNRSPFEVFVSYLTFNTGSSYNRILIWQYGSAEVLRHPLFGIGFNDWTRPWWMHSGSMDNFWLLQAVRFGVPAFVLLALALVLVLFKVGRIKGLNDEDKKLRDGFVISMVGVFFAIASVHLWNATFCWLIFLFGSSLGFLNSTRDRADVPAEAHGQNQQQRRPGYVRPRPDRTGAAPSPVSAHASQTIGFRR